MDNKRTKHISPGEQHLTRSPFGQDQFRDYNALRRSCYPAVDKGVAACLQKTHPFILKPEGIVSISRDTSDKS